MTKISDIYIPGDKKMRCDICGFYYRKSQMKWGVAAGQKGFIVCPVDFDTVHPLENKKKYTSGRKKSKDKFPYQSNNTGST